MSYRHGSAVGSSPGSDPVVLGRKIRALGSRSFMGVLESIGIAKQQRAAQESQIA